MISYSSNINLQTANKIFDEYITILTEKLSANNQLIEHERNRIKELNLPSNDTKYIINTLSSMIHTNNTYITLLSAFKKEYSLFAKQYFHEIKYYSPATLNNTLNEHIQKLTQDISKQT